MTLERLPSVIASAETQGAPKQSRWLLRAGRHSNEARPVLVSREPLPRRSAGHDCLASLSRWSRNDTREAPECHCECRDARSAEAIAVATTGRATLERG